MASNFLNKIKSAVFVVDEEAPPANTAQLQQGTSVEPLSQTQVTPEPRVKSENTDFRQGDLMKKLCSRLEASATLGLDYMKLRSVVSDEETTTILPNLDQRFLFVFKTLSKTYPEATKETVLNSIDSYVNLLKQWKNEAMDEISKKRQSVQASIDSISKKREQIEALEREISDINTRISTVTDKCDADETEMNQAVDFLVQSILSDRGIIERVL